jgi:hypothetical protein
VTALLAGALGRPGERMVIGICAYTESTREPQDPRPYGIATALVLRGLALLLPGRFADHRALHRDHFANPRGLAYLIDLAARLGAEVVPAAPPDLLIDAAYPELEDGAFRSAFARVERGATARFAALGTPPLLADALRGAHDTVVLVHADALGLGCELLERVLLADPARRVLVVNGRRRVYALTSDARRALRLRRFLARTRLPELGFALAVWPVAAWLALVDAWRSRSGTSA